MSAAASWPFVIAAYAVCVGGVAALAGWSVAALRRAEARAEMLDRR